MSARESLLRYLTKTDGYNTLSVRQAQARFGIQNVSARISELRREGYAVYTNVRQRADGSKVYVYRLGSPSRSFRRWFRENGIRAQRVA